MGRPRVHEAVDGVRCIVARAVQRQDGALQQDRRGTFSRVASDGLGRVLRDACGNDAVLPALPDGGDSGAHDRARAVHLLARDARRPQVMAARKARKEERWKIESVCLQR